MLSNTPPDDFTLQRDHPLTVALLTSLSTLIKTCMLSGDRNKLFNDKTCINSFISFSHEYIYQIKAYIVNPNYIENKAFNVNQQQNQLNSTEILIRTYCSLVDNVYIYIYIPLRASSIDYTQHWYQGWTWWCSNPCNSYEIIGHNLYQHRIRNEQKGHSGRNLWSFCPRVWLPETTSGKSRSQHLTSARSTRSAMAKYGVGSLKWLYFKN